MTFGQKQTAAASIYCTSSRLKLTVSLGLAHSSDMTGNFVTNLKINHPKLHLGKEIAI